MKAREKKYVSVEKFILKNIQNGTYKPGDKIPTEEEIMSMLGFSRSPVRHAIALLEQEGYIYKIHGSGSFVRQTVTDDLIDIYALLYANSKGIEKDFIHGMRQAVNYSLSLPETHQFRFAIPEIAKNAKSIVERLRKDQVSAIFCLESEIALEIYKVLAEYDISVPEQISLCSFDDHSFTGFREEFITAVVQPLEKLGYLAVDLILRGLEQKSQKPIKMIMETSIPERQSVAQV